MTPFYLTDFAAFVDNPRILSRHARQVLTDLTRLEAVAGRSLRTLPRGKPRKEKKDGIRQRLSPFSEDHGHRFLT